MAFSQKQVRALKRDIAPGNTKTRVADGRQFSFIEGWHAIAQANRIFGFGCWDRETTELKCVATRSTEKGFVAIYVAKVRITVRGETGTVVREGHGSSEGRGMTPYEAHSMGLKGAETDATKRAMATFGKPFGLALYSDERREVTAVGPTQSGTLTGSEIEPDDGRDHSPPPPPEHRVETEARQPTPARPPGRVDKSVLTISVPKRHRDKAHLRRVALQGCLVCGLKPADAHHIRHAQPRAIGLKVSDEFTVPLCRGHHRELHNHGSEPAWWHDMGIDPFPVAKRLWEESFRRSGVLETTADASALGDEAEPALARNGVDV